MFTSEEWKNPQAWSAPGFTLDEYTLVFLPGGHDKAVRQIMDSETVHRLLAAYFPKTQRPDGVKAVGAICHGVLVVSKAKGADGQSVLHDCTTTTLPARFEQAAYWGTRLFLGDYYKTYGAGTEDLEDSVSFTSFLTIRLLYVANRVIYQVKKCLKDPSKQFKGSLGLMP